MKNTGLTLALTFVLMWGTGCSSRDGSHLQVYAAASLTEILSDVQRGKGDSLAVRTEGSGTLAREIVEGAPADVFLSADPAWLDDLEHEGLILPGSRGVVAGNRLAVVATPGHPPLQSLRDLRRLSSIALGEWTSVPAGAYAKEALEGVGLWHELLPRCIFTHNVRGALRLVEEGQADAALVYASDARLASDTESIYLVPDSLHRPIRIEGCVLQAAADTARARRFLQDLAGPPTRDLWLARGFTPVP